MTAPVRRLTRPPALAFALLLTYLLLPIVGNQPLAAQSTSARRAPARAPAQATGSTIAYVLSNDATGDEIRFIQPDGSNDRRIWHVNKADPEGVESIGALAWRPDATELAFDSDHEGACSLWAYDLFSIRPDGSAYRRITQSPACAELAAYAKGTVHVPVRNFSFDATVFFPYFQGAPSIQMITLAPGQSGTVTFENVADFGSNQAQFAVAISGAGRWLDAGAAADVQPGGEVTTPPLTISSQAHPELGAAWPSWHRSGDKLSFVFGFGSPYQITAQPEPLEIGEMLLPEDAESPLFMDHLQWGPTEATANQLLYAGGGDFDVPAGIYRMTAGSGNAGERLLSFETYDLIYGLDWLPDGSGFVYAVTEEFLTRANIFIYRFDTGQPTRLTEYTEHFAGILSVSPDGQQIVFERAVNTDDLILELGNYQVWIMGIDGSDPRLLAESGRAPAWSPREPTVPQPPATPTTPTTPRRGLYVPLIIRR